MQFIKNTKRTRKQLSSISAEKFGVVYADGSGTAHIRLTADNGDVYELLMTMGEATTLGKRLTELQLPESYLER